MNFEFLIPRRPLSVQAKRSRLQTWKNYVRGEATKTWSGPVFTNGDLQMTLVYLCDLSPPDIDNIVKPIQDALIGLVFFDDALIADVESHRRSINGTFNLTRLPALITAGIASGQECVYVRVSSSLQLEEYL